MKELAGEEEEEAEMEDEECDTMDETAGEARCKGYLSALRKSRAKKR
jgi:hypothetical protein